MLSLYLCRYNSDIVHYLYWYNDDVVHVSVDIIVISSTIYADIIAMSFTIRYICSRIINWTLIYQLSSFYLFQFVYLQSLFVQFV